MAFSISDIFRFGAGPVAQQQPAAIMDPMNPNNPNLPQNQQQPQQPVAKADDPKTPPEPPVEDYKGLWNTDPNAKAPVDPADFNFNINKDAVNKMFGEIDFTKVISQDILTKINAGGPEATSALLTAMNAMLQESTKKSVLAASQLTEAGIKTSGQRMKDYIPSVVRDNQVSSALREDNPLMKDSRYAPMVEAVTIQMSRQFPNGTPSEIKEHTRKYFDNMVNDVAQHSGRQVVDAPKTVPQGVVQTDWSTEPT